MHSDRSESSTNVVGMASVSTATTEGIKVNVRAVYVPEQSLPRVRRYVFAYTVRIANEGETPAQS